MDELIREESAQRRNILLTNRREDFLPNRKNRMPDRSVVGNSHALVPGINRHD